MTFTLIDRDRGLDPVGVGAHPRGAAVVILFMLVCW